MRHLDGQLVIDFANELRRPLPGWSYCPCGKLVSLADEPAFAEDAAGNMRAWHRLCRMSEHDEQRAKRARKRLHGA